MIQVLLITCLLFVLFAAVAAKVVFCVARAVCLLFIPVLLLPLMIIGLVSALLLMVLGLIALPVLLPILTMLFIFIFLPILLIKCLIF